MQQNTLSKCEIKDLYVISYPTLRTKLRNAGLTEFIGRRRFNPDEIYLIFMCLGLPKTIEAIVLSFCQSYAEFKTNCFSAKEKDLGAGLLRSAGLPYKQLVESIVGLRCLSIQLFALRGRIKLRKSCSTLEMS